MKPKREIVAMQVVIKESVRKKLKLYALNLDITMSELAEKLLEEGLERIEKQETNNQKKTQDLHKN